MNDQTVALFLPLLIIHSPSLATRHLRDIKLEINIILDLRQTHPNLLGHIKAPAFGLRKRVSRLYETQPFTLAQRPSFFIDVVSTWLVVIDLSGGFEFDVRVHEWLLVVLAETAGDVQALSLARVVGECALVGAVVIIGVIAVVIGGRKNFTNDLCVVVIIVPLLFGYNRLSVVAIVSERVIQVWLRRVDCLTISSSWHIGCFVHHLAHDFRQSVLNFALLTILSLSRKLLKPFWDHQNLLTILTFQRRDRLDVDPEDLPEKIMKNMFKVVF